MIHQILACLIQLLLLLHYNWIVILSFSFSCISLFRIRISDCSDIWTGLYIYLNCYNLKSSCSPKPKNSRKNIVQGAFQAFKILPWAIQHWERESNIPSWRYAGLIWIKRWLINWCCLWCNWILIYCKTRTYLRLFETISKCLFDNYNYPVLLTKVSVIIKTAYHRPYIWQ